MARSYAVKEVLTLDLERFNKVHLRYQYVAGSRQQLELPETVEASK
jgi:hypothetical protein